MAERPLEGRVTLVTGGSRGIGAAISQQLAAAGAKVGVNYTANREAADAVVAAITAAGGEAVAIHGDVSDPEAAGAMVDATEEAFGDDLWNLVANAGITRDNLISRITPEDWDRVIDVNLKGTFFMCRHAIPELKKTSGCIVNLSSDDLDIAILLFPHEWSAALAVSHRFPGSVTAGQSGREGGERASPGIGRFGHGQAGEHGEPGQRHREAAEPGHGHACARLPGFTAGVAARWAGTSSGA